MPKLANLKGALQITITNMITINISLNKELADIVEHEVKTKKYANRSEFFRDLLRKNYILNDIEELDKNDPDYKLVKKMEKDSEFIDISALL